MTHSRILIAAVLVLLGCSGKLDPRSQQKLKTPEHAGSTVPAPPSPSSDSGVPAVEVAASHILVQYAGAPRAREGVVRTRDEALDLSFDIAQQARQGADFATLAAQYSDGPLADRGGYLGVFQTDEMDPAFSRALLDLQIGEISDPVETPYGFHVIRREPVERIGVRQIVIAYAGAKQAPATVTRTRAEAKSLAEDLLARIQAGESFEELARANSDGPAAEGGGDVGLLARGSMPPAFEQAALSCPVGEVRGVVETPYGFHIIQRTQ